MTTYQKILSEGLSNLKGKSVTMNLVTGIMGNIILEDFYYDVQDLILYFGSTKDYADMSIIISDIVKCEYDDMLNAVTLVLLNGSVIVFSE